jgi:hypothetical protein
MDVMQRCPNHQNKWLFHICELMCGNQRKNCHTISEEMLSIATSLVTKNHSYDILSAGMLWKPKEAILTNFIDQPVNIR